MKRPLEPVPADLSPKELRALIRHNFTELDRAFARHAEANRRLISVMAHPMAAGRPPKARNPAFDALLVQRFGYRPSDRALVKMRAACNKSLGKIRAGEPVARVTVERLANVLRIPMAKLLRAIVTE